MRVLLADDQVSLRSALRLLLEYESNIEVVGEVGKAGALPESLARLRPDLLLLDWGLPEMKTTRGRRQLITSLRTILPQVYIIALSSPQNTEGYMLTAGADAMVSKAESPQHLLAAIHQVEAAYQQNQRATDLYHEEVK